MNLAKSVIYELREDGVVELYLQPYTGAKILESLGIDDANSHYFHVVCYSDFSKLIYYKGGSSCFREEIESRPFLIEWAKLNVEDLVKLRMLKTTYSLPESAARRKLVLNEFIEEILKPTDGYLIFQDQVAAILRTLRMVNPKLIPMYISNWNLKKPNTRFMANTIYIGDYTLDEIIEDRAYDSENQFFYI